MYLIRSGDLWDLTQVCKDSKVTIDLSYKFLQLFQLYDLCHNYGNLILVLQDDPTQSLVIPVCLPWTSTQSDLVLDVGKSYTVAGWGRLDNNLALAKANLRKFATVSRLSV